MRCTFCRDHLHRSAWVHIAWTLACVACAYAIGAALPEVDVALGTKPQSAGDA